MAPAEDDRPNEAGDDERRFPVLPPPVELPDAPNLNPALPEPRKPTGVFGGSPGEYGRMAMASQAVASFVTPIALLSVLGWYLDGRFHWTPWGAFCGVILGFAVGVRLLLTVVQRLGN